MLFLRMPLAAVLFASQVVSQLPPGDPIFDLPLSRICAAAPCHDEYIERGVATVTQTRIGGPSESGGALCCV